MNEAERMAAEIERLADITIEERRQREQFVEWLAGEFERELAADHGSQVAKTLGFVLSAAQTKLNARWLPA
jgi:hypothetical protein